MKLAIEVIGWSGAALMLLAYLLLSKGRLHGGSASYHWMNIVAALGFIVNSGYNGAIPSATINVIWIGIGAFALLRLRLRRPEGANSN